MMEFLLSGQTVMIFITALIFTVVGWIWGKQRHVELVVASTIESLIEDGYLKTQGTGKDMQILKWREWHGQAD